MAKATVTIVVLSMASVMLMTMPVQAQVYPAQPSGSIVLPSGVTPDYSFNTAAFLSFRPNPVGLGQTVLVNVWVVPPMYGGRYLTGYKVTITKPDGTKDVHTMDSYPGDATAWFEFVPDQDGTWKLKF